VTTTRIRRTPEQLIADLERKLAQAKARAEGKAIVSDPNSPHASALDTLNKEEAILRKDLAAGPQGCEYRLRAHKLWIAEIEARMAYATARLPEVLAIKEEIRKNAANSVADVPSLANRFDTARLYATFTECEALRKANTAQRKASKVENEADAMETVENLPTLEAAE
jgi:hypothetical protein